MDDLSQFCCQNTECPDYGQRGAGNLSVCDRYGKNKQFRQLYCHTCKARFSERKGTPLYGGRLSEEKALAILQHLQDGCGTRATARLVGVKPDTVTRYVKLAGQHAKALHDELVAFSPADERDPMRREVGIRPQKRKKLRP